MRSLTRLVAFALTLGALAACGTAPPPPPPPPPAPPPVASCFAELDARGIAYDRIKDFHNDQGCGIDQAIRVNRSAVPWSRPSLVSCPFELVEWDFETKIVQPAALRILKKKVTKLVHAGTYDCRGERGGHADRLSQHAFGKAIDVLGFELEGGEVVSVHKDWAGDGPKARFLHEVAKGACTLFDVVITPNHNSFHADHIHMDTGPYKLCGM